MNKFNSLISNKLIVLIFLITHIITSTLAQDNIFPTYFDTKAKYAYLVDYNSGEALFDKNGNVPMSPSSMTKMMTTYIIFDQLKKGLLKLSDRFTISEKAAAKGGSKMFIKTKQKVSVDNLLKGAIVLSGNDACIALAEGLYGSESVFVDKMNSEAKRLRLNGTVFKNSTGWPDDGHLMTAKDLSVLASELIKKFPEYYYYHAIKEYSFNKIKQSNRNMLIGFAGVDGIKTGKTDIGGYGIVVSAERNGRRLIGIVNGLASEKERNKEGERLLNYGFNNFKNITLFRNEKKVTKSEVAYGNTDQVSLNVNDKVIITLPNEYNQINDLLLMTELKEPLKAPLRKGDTVGTLNIMTSKEKLLIKKVDLIAGEDVEKPWIVKRMFQSIKYFCKRMLN